MIDIIDPLLPPEYLSEIPIDLIFSIVIRARRGENDRKFIGKHKRKAKGKSKTKTEDPKTEGEGGDEKGERGIGSKKRVWS